MNYGSRVDSGRHCVRTDYESLFGCAEVSRRASRSGMMRMRAVSWSGPEEMVRELGSGATAVPGPGFPASGVRRATSSRFRRVERGPRVECALGWSPKLPYRRGIR